MGQAREVWHAEEAWVSIFLEGAGTATHVAKFVQNVSIKRQIEVLVSGQPGAANNDIDSIPGIYECSIGEFYWKMATQWTPFLDTTKRWKVVFSNVNPYYDGASQVNDSITLRNAAISAPSVAWQKGEIQVSTLDFKAESAE